MATKSCFVISPIGDPNSEVRKHADAVFLGIIAPALEELRACQVDIEAIRSDQLQEPGKITEQMFREIFTRDLCIVVLTLSNPNVFYELAVAQCAYRPVVALLEEGRTPPFDVADLRTVSYNLNDTLRLIRRDDAKTLAQHLRTMLDPIWKPPDPFGPNAPAAWAAVRDPLGVQKLIETTRPRPLPPAVDAIYSLPGDPRRQVIIRTGDVRYLSDIDVVVSSENTDMQLARYCDPSVSGTLRYLDAERGVGGQVVRDALDEGLKTLVKQSSIRLPVMPGTVLPLPTTGLQEKRIKYVFLAATVRGDGPGGGYSSIARVEVENCVRACFEQFDQISRRQPLDSILFPVFGAGTAKQDPEQVVTWFLPALLDAMRDTSACERLYVLAWVESHRAALRNVATALGLTRSATSE